MAPPMRPGSANSYACSSMRASAKPELIWPHWPPAAAFLVMKLLTSGGAGDISQLSHEVEDESNQPSCDKDSAMPVSQGERLHAANRGSGRRSLRAPQRVNSI